MDKDTFFKIKTTLNIRGELMDIFQPKVMGILNITPDSFYAGSRLSSDKEILTKAEKMLSEGADFLDLGAYSSRPGAADVSSQEEIDRLIPTVKLINKEFPAAIQSVDTFRAEAAKEAILAGAHIINDISGGTLDDRMFDVAAELKVPYILMHMKGNPQNMSKLNHYEDLTLEVIAFLSEKINQLKQKGVKDIIIDPGFGFAKNAEQNFLLLKEMKSLLVLGYPLLAGLSRKTMIWKNLGIKPEEALNGTSILNLLALQNGAGILRVHDVKEAKECIQLYHIYQNTY